MMSERSEGTNKHGSLVGCGACGAAACHLSADAETVCGATDVREAL